MIKATLYIRCPSLLTGDSIDMSSVNSLDAILVDPPAMFDGEQGQDKRVCSDCELPIYMYIHEYTVCIYNI